MIECTECGCPYNENLSSCPECGNPNYQNLKFVNTTGLTNCPNCGAPVTNNIACEYCESAFPYHGENNVIIDDDMQQESDEGIGTGTAAFLGGLIGGFLSD